MSVFDELDINVDGVEIDVDQLNYILNQEPEPTNVNWRVVERWCVEHPLQVRLIVGRPSTTTTHLRKTYPNLTVRGVRHRFNEIRVGMTCDILVTHVPPGEPSPFGDEVPGVVLRPRKDNEDGPAASGGSDEG